MGLAGQPFISILHYSCSKNSHPPSGLRTSYLSSRLLLRTCTVNSQLQQETATVCMVYQNLRDITMPLTSQQPTCSFQRFNCKNGAAYITTCTYPVEARFICLLYGSSTQQVVFKRLLTPNRLLFPFLLCIKVCSRCRTALFVSLEGRRMHTHSYAYPRVVPFFFFFGFPFRPQALG